MPLYDYECAACGRRFEVFHGVNAEPPTSCPLCGKGPVRKVITAAAVHYRGSGWAKKERRTAAASKSGSKDEAGGDESSKESAKETSKDEGSGDAAAATKGSSSKGKTGKTVDKTPAATGD